MKKKQKQKPETLYHGVEAQSGSITFCFIFNVATYSHCFTEQRLETLNCKTIMWLEKLPENHNWGGGGGVCTQKHQFLLKEFTLFSFLKIKVSYGYKRKSNIQKSLCSGFPLFKRKQEKTVYVAVFARFSWTLEAPEEKEIPIPHLSGPRHAQEHDKREALSRKKDSLLRHCRARCGAGDPRRGKRGRATPKRTRGRREARCPAAARRARGSSGEIPGSPNETFTESARSQPRHPCRSLPSDTHQK